MKSRIVQCIAGAFLILTVPLAYRVYIVSGKPPSGETLKRYESMPNFRGGRFHNQEKTCISFGPLDMLRSIVENFQKPPRTVPGRDIPTIKTDLDAGTAFPSVVWFGHSSYLIRSQGFAVLVDPVLCGYAGPFPVLMRAFRGSDAYRPDDMPPVDLLIITHDHYDHLDYETVTALKKKIRKIVVPAGVGSDFVFWGFDPSSLVELGWNETAVLSEDIRITAVPARHLSGRIPYRDRTLWASFVLAIHGRTLFIGGDGGYGSHFRETGDAYGPFDLAFLENGRYNPRRTAAHMLPEQAVQAAVDLRARIIMPVHWAKFESRCHPWNEPVRRLLREADRRGVRVTVPMIGEAYSLGAPERRAAWWESD